jgi:hypothetical protein
MKNKFRILIALIVLIILTIACGSSDEITVKPGDTDPNNSQSASVEETKPVGTVRSNPAPKGSIITADNMDFSVLETIRPADEIVMAGNQFNTKPEEGYQYILTKLQIKCNKSSDESCSISPFNFELIGDEGIIYDSEWFLAGVDGMLESKEFYGGATVSGYIGSIIKSSDTTLILTYDPFIGDKFYMSIE